MKKYFSSIVFILIFLFSITSLSASPVRIFIMSGQSNMVGIGNLMDLPDDLRGPQPGVIIYNAGSGEYGWTTLEPGVGAYTGSFGSEVTFGRDMAAAFPGETIALIKIAWSATSLASDWLSPSAGGPGPLWLKFQEHLEEALNTLPGDLEGEIQGMCWMQGESDACSIYPASDYEENLTAFIADIRALVNLPGMPFIIAMVDDDPTWIEFAVVREAEQNVARNVSGVGIFDTKDYPAASGHYHGAGLILMGEDFASKLLPFLQGGPTPVVGPLPGDVNGDDQINIIDALMIAQYYVGLQPQGFIEVPGDVNGDDQINIIDALMIAQYYVGLINL